MANYPRSLIVFDGSLFHVTWKCHNNDWLLESAFAKQLYYELLLQYKHRYKITIFSYCLMDNHPHLTGQCESQKLMSDFFRTVNSCFAKILNQELKRKGQVVMDRFKSPTVQSDEDLQAVMVYNDLNPYRTRKRIKPRSFKYTSYHHYAYGKQDPLLTDPEWYKSLGKTAKERQDKYRSLIEDLINDNEKKSAKCPYRDEENYLCFIGNPHWVKKHHNRLRKKVNEHRKQWKEKFKAAYQPFL